ncbi:MAG: winged helix-turn-helix transcriptional regulator [Clostridia bacterium]|nr:winged helix-turn-helix transcriptional regulator [Clostridia bacterium]
MELCNHDHDHEETVHQAKIHAMSEEDLQTICSVFKVISEPSRMRIILALMEGELCVYHIVEAVEGTQSAVSHQLRILKDNKIIRARRDGKNIVYSIADEHILNIIKMSRQHLHCEVSE